MNMKRFALVLTTLFVIVATAIGFLGKPTSNAAAQTQAQFRVDAAP